MSIKESKAIVRRFLEDVWNKGNSDLVHEMISAGFIRYGPAVEEVRGREGFQRLVATYRSGCPDLRVALEDQVAEGALGATRWTARGTHRGELMGIAPIGRQITVAGVIVYRVSGDKIEAEWAYYDVMGMRQHLGPPRCNRSSRLPPDGMGRLPHDVRESMLPWYAGAETLGAMAGGGAG